MNSFKKNIFRTSETEILVFDPFDFMVVRFTYTKPADGTDLDIMVYYDGTGTIYDKDAVGFNQLPNATKIPTDATPDADAYLWWASDDVALPAGECVEAVVIGINTYESRVEFSSITQTTSNTLFHIFIFSQTGLFQENNSETISCQTTATFSKLFK